MAKLVVAGDKSGQEAVFVKALLVGLSGAGKSTCMSKAPMPLFIEPSAQAMASIRAANPQAVVFLIENLQDVRDALYSLKNAERIDFNGMPALRVKLQQEPSVLMGKKPIVYGEHIIQSVCLDDIEEIQDMMKKEVQADPRYEKELASVGDDGMTMRMWGTVIDRFFSMLRAFRSIPANFFAAAKVGRIQDKEENFHELVLAGKNIKVLLPGLFNAVGYVYRKEATEADSRTRLVGFDLPEKFLSKGHPALEAVEDPEPTVWWAKMREHSGVLRDKAQVKRASLPPQAPAPMSSKSPSQGKDLTLTQKISKITSLINRAVSDSEILKALEAMDRIRPELDESIIRIIETSVLSRCKHLGIDAPTLEASKYHQSREDLKDLTESTETDLEEESETDPASDIQEKHFDHTEETSNATSEAREQAQEQTTQDAEKQEGQAQASTVQAARPRRSNRLSVRK